MVWLGPGWMAAARPVVLGALGGWPAEWPVERPVEPSERPRPL